MKKLIIFGILLLMLFSACVKQPLEFLNVKNADMKHPTKVAGKEVTLEELRAYHNKWIKEEGINPEKECMTCHAESNVYPSQGPQSCTNGVCHITLGVKVEF